ncbi:hypothetical protein T07_13458 [Trichinella nelsoni]|uniref:Uncharacterized protein n=1 Tax=Trichinella nelsoni TaxID=6336 RepID=A0A0V0SBB3_9BILA|nr:hypothetical protein T07_13458 [Trichinella nelsoni]
MYISYNTKNMQISVRKISGIQLVGCVTSMLLHIVRTLIFHHISDYLINRSTCTTQLIDQLFDLFHHNKATHKTHNHQKIRLDSESQIRLMHRTHIRKMSITASAQCDKLKVTLSENEI